MEKKLVPAPIDNKNLAEDAFEDDVFNDFYKAHDHRVGKVRHLIGHHSVDWAVVNGVISEEAIVDVRWNWGESYIRITVLAVPNVSDFEYVRNEILNDYRRIFKSWETETENLVVDFYQLVNTMNVIFNFQCE
ncbi:MAG: hypothetical protein K6A67_11345 [Bacteroidales bacterium]|nr:hypothetical protein [Bacteroidales bacterium]